MDVKAFLDYLKDQPYYQGQLVHVARLPARRARYGKLEQGLPESLVQSLAANGTRRLYRHQAQAINAVRRGENVVVSTGTASGKSLCYNLPVVDTLMQDHRARAMYLFPTKALAHDQLRSLSTLLRPLPYRPQVGVYDGDTPQPLRTKLRREAALILSNPDMLHLGILPHHHLWADFLRNLRYVVLDEAHTYRGVFGAQVAAILRRLDRLCVHYGSRPQFIASSATIANPGEHMARLTGHSAQVIDDDGAPRAGKLFALWNPPFTNPEHTTRRSAYGEAAALFADMVRQDVRNITFTRARVTAELVLKYARTALKRSNPDLCDRVASYRAGYLADHRRELEETLSSGQLIGVTSTNALELGVDVGGLDATISVGYPGSIASLWQQIGRAGRRVNGRHDTSLAVLIGLDNPLDQYFMRNPEDLLDRAHEHALIDPGNLYVLKQHLACAAQELPLTPQDEVRFGEGFVAAMIELEKELVLVYQAESDSWIYMGPNYPAQRVNIRSIGRKPVMLRDETRHGAVLEVMDASMAPARVHPGAIYIHRGESYRVSGLDLEAGEATLTPIDVDYYTQTRELNEIRIGQVLREQVHRRAMVYWGKVRVTQHVVAYRKIRHLTERKSEESALNLPPDSFQTRALWWSLPQAWRKAVSRRGWRFSGGLQAIQNAMMALLPLFTMCDRHDLGGHTTAVHPETGLAYIFIYDQHPGGVGISEQGFQLIERLWQTTLDTIQACPCEFGCPSCIFSTEAGDNNADLDKRAAMWILEALLRP